MWKIFICRDIIERSWKCRLCGTGAYISNDSEGKGRFEEASGLFLLFACEIYCSQFSGC